MKRTAVELVLKLDMALGEGVFWDGTRASLVWVDIVAGVIHELSDGVHRTYAVDTHVGMAAPHISGGWVLGVRDGFATFDPAHRELRLLRGVNVPGTRMNDGNVDRKGRLFAGSMAYTEETGGGRLYRLDPDLSLTVVLDQVSISNGIDWSPDQRDVYYVDSTTRTIASFDFDQWSATWSNRRLFVDLSAHRGFPDGLSVDEEGCVWVAMWDGYTVQRYTPTGSLDQVVLVPAPRVTACGFGGPDLATLYITTARRGLSSDSLGRYPLSGSLFAVRPGVAGRARQPFGA